MGTGMHLEAQQETSTAPVTKTSFFGLWGYIILFHYCKHIPMILLWYQNVRLKAVKFGIKQRNRVVGSV